MLRLPNRARAQSFIQTRAAWVKIVILFESVLLPRLT